MTKAQGKISQIKEPDSPAKDSKGRRARDKGRAETDKDEDALFGRVKKVIKRSRRKLSEEKFEKQLQRTIAFLEDLQSKLAGSNNSVKATEATGATGATGSRKRAKVVKKAKPKTSSKKKKSSAAAIKQPLAAAAKTDE